jgi:hypothetical protein
MSRAFRVIGLFLLVGPAAQAQPAPSPAQVAAPTAPAAAPAAPTPVDLSIPQKSTISGTEMLDQGRDYRRQIESTGIQIQAQAQQAKSDKDVIRLNCLLDKLTQVKVNANMMDQALQSLQEAISRRDESAQLHEYTRVTIINQKVQVLRTEADACVGAETNYVGPTKVVVETPPNLQESVDQPNPALPPINVILRPPPASPTQ